MSPRAGARHLWRRLAVPAVAAAIVCLVTVGQAGAGDGTWTPVGEGTLPAAVQEGGVRLVVADPGIPGRLLLGTDAGLYRTTNQGASWASVVKLESSVVVGEVVFDPDDARIAYATTDVVRG